MKITIKLFKIIVDAQVVPSDWCKGSISSIFKAEDRCNPDNYRGTCVIRRLSKLFLLILNARLNEFLEVNNTLNKCLIGLQKNNRTTDHIFPLKILLNKYVHNTNKGKSYSCFVDFRQLMTLYGVRASLQNYLQ